MPTLRNTLRLILGLAGAALGTGGAVSFWQYRPACPVPGLPLVEMAILSVAGLAMVVLSSRGNAARWDTAHWAICGGLAALVIIGVWSFAPWALLVLGAFGLSGILGQKLFSRRTLANLGVLVAVAAINFVLLFPLAKRSGVQVVEIPAASFVRQAFPHVDYADAYRAKLWTSAPRDVESVTRAVLACLLPCWAAESSHQQHQAALATASFLPGRSMGGWTAYHKAPEEIVVGADQPHLDFRLSIFLSHEEGTRWVTVSTVVRYNNWQGRGYFLPVRIGHQIIVPHMVRSAVRTLR